MRPPAVLLFAAAVAGEAARVRNVAVIGSGAGAAGASAAYHLQKYAAAEDLAVNITIFEKTSHIGGRTLTVNAFDDPSEPVELGASIFVKLNHILYNATQDFDLPLKSPSPLEDGDLTAIWDGDSFVYVSVRGTSWWQDLAKMFWKYGLAPYRATKLSQRVVGTFLKMYTEPFFPFRSLTQRVQELGLDRVTSVTGEQLLSQNKIGESFAREIIQPATRVNYASNLAYIHGLETMVSIATDGAVAVAGGNWQIFHQMVRHSRAAVYLNTSVASIALSEDVGEPRGPRRYLLSTRDASAEASETENPIAFDNVIIASPWQFSHIKASEDVVTEPIDEIPYTRLHVTLFTSPLKLSPVFFGLEPGSRAPSNVYTTLSEYEKPREGAAGVGKTGLYSISTLRHLINPRSQKREYLYKIFSAKAVSADFLSKILDTRVPTTIIPAADVKERTSTPISWYHPHWFHSYPVELPRVTFQDPMVGPGLYYTSGIESFISTMETSALMGMNVARLLADEIAAMEGEKAGKISEAWRSQEEITETRRTGSLRGEEL